jgi:hypothetical protein
MWHIIPNNDIKEHKLNSDCECNCIIGLLNNGEFICIHNSYDGREYIEKLFTEFSKN